MKIFKIVILALTFLNMATFITSCRDNQTSSKPQSSSENNSQTSQSTSEQPSPSQFRLNQLLSSNFPLIRFPLEKEENIIAANILSYNSKKGCYFEPGQEVIIDSYYVSTFETNFYYIFKKHNVKSCPLDQGFVNKDKVETNDIFLKLPSNYALISKDNRKGVIARVWKAHDAPEVCRTEPGDALLIKGNPEVVSRQFIQVDIVPKYSECKGGKAFIDRRTVHLNGVKLVKVDNFTLTKPFYTPIRPEPYVNKNKAKWIKSKNVNAKSIKRLGLSRNMLAFLDVIAYAEGTKERYDLQYTFESFASFYKHPRKRHCFKKLCSDAAGRYQILSNTWDMIRTYADLKDFSPRNQDLAAVQLIRWRRAAGLVNNIRSYYEFKKALKKVSIEWASLPGSPWGQPIKSSSELWKVFKKAKKKFS